MPFDRRRLRSPVPQLIFGVSSPAPPAGSHFLDTTGTLHITDTGITCALNLRSYHPILIAGFADLNIPIPWWEGRTLRYRLPPR